MSNLRDGGVIKHMTWTFEPCVEGGWLVVCLEGALGMCDTAELAKDIHEKVADGKFKGIVFCGNRLETSDTFANEIRDVAPGVAEILRGLSQYKIGLLPVNPSQYGMARQLFAFVRGICPTFEIFRSEEEMKTYFSNTDPASDEEPLYMRPNDTPVTSCAV